MKCVIENLYLQKKRCVLVEGCDWWLVRFEEGLVGEQENGGGRGSVWLVSLDSCMIAE